MLKGYLKLLNFPLLPNFSVNLELIDTFSLCHIFFRFSDGVPLIFLNQSLFDEFQGITLTLFWMGGGGANLPPAVFLNIAQKPLGLGS